MACHNVTKNIPSAVIKLGSRAKKNMEETWSCELADEGALLKNHMHQSLENHHRDQELKANLETAITHFQHNHDKFHKLSACKNTLYVLSCIIVREPVAMKLLTDLVHSLIP